MAKKYKPKQFRALSAIPMRSKRSMEDEFLTGRDVKRNETVTVINERVVSGVTYGQIGPDLFVVLSRPGYINFREV